MAEFASSLSCFTVPWKQVFIRCLHACNTFATLPQYFQTILTRKKQANINYSIRFQREKGIYFWVTLSQVLFTVNFKTVFLQTSPLYSFSGKKKCVQPLLASKLIQSGYIWWTTSKHKWGSLSLTWCSKLVFFLKICTFIVKNRLLQDQIRICLIWLGTFMSRRHEKNR